MRAMKRLFILAAALPALFLLADLFSDYRRRIREVLRKEDEQPKDSLAALVSSLLLEEASIRIAPVGINRTGLHSSVLLSSPPPGRAVEEMPAFLGVG